jgi:hypothetical protein
MSERGWGQKGVESDRLHWVARPRSGGRIAVFGWLGLALLVAQGPMASQAQSGPAAAYSVEHAITVDATALTPLTRWHVPGITPIIWSMDPYSTDAYKTTEVQVVKLKPGPYRFGTFTFDFPFEITLDGVLNFTPSLDQCVLGRGTQKLTVLCSRTQPYGGEREY